MKRYAVRADRQGQETTIALLASLEDAKQNCDTLPPKWRSFVFDRWTRKIVYCPELDTILRNTNKELV